jgi:hypothetical protein
MVLPKARNFVDRRLERHTREKKLLVPTVDDGNDVV